jgi:hypothetical protein
VQVPTKNGIIGIAAFAYQRRGTEFKQKDAPI